MTDSVSAWRVEALVPLPRFAQMAPGGGLPEQLNFESAVPHPITIEREGLTFTLAGQPNHAFSKEVAPAEIASVLCIVEAESATEALQASAPVLENVVDFLVLQLQQPLPLVQLEVLDVTPPVAVGDARTMMLFPFPQGYVFAKYQQSHQLNVTVQPVVNLDLPPEWSAPHARAARDWYLKSLAARNDADTFMLAWISLEVMFDRSGVVVLETPTCQKGHAQLEQACHVCGEVNRRFVRGASIKKFLSEVCGVLDDDARKLWNMRQMFHGSIALDQTELADLARLTTVLQAAALAQVKARCGLDPVAPPLIQPGGMTISGFALEGMRDIQQVDI